MMPMKVEGKENGTATAATKKSNGTRLGSKADATAANDRKMPICSGLSSLIQAATELLGDGYASSSDGDHRILTPAHTPNMISEDARKVSVPEMLMSLLLDPQNSDILTFLPDGKFFAIRTKEFAEDIMTRHFHVKTFDEFLELIHACGFSRISGDDNNGGSIQVFRNPHFTRTGIDTLQSLQQPGDKRRTSFSDKSKIEYSLSDDSQGSSSKRRLSPSYLERGMDDASSVQKQHRSLEQSSSDCTPPSMTASHNGSEPSQARRRSSIETRSYALAITAAKLDLHASDEEEDEKSPAMTQPPITRRPSRRSSARLVDGGVEKATHVIVTDAIETLLFDEGHTRETYLKHEQELSRSSLPGVETISQQLFAPHSLSTATQLATSNSSPLKTDDSSKENEMNVASRKEQLEAAAALMKQAGAPGSSQTRNQPTSYASAETLLSEKAGRNQKSPPP